MKNQTQQLITYFMAKTQAEISNTSVPKKATLREWIGLGVLAIACLLYVMDLTVLHLAVPSMSEELRPSSAQLLWIIDIYGFMVAGFLVTMGTLGDRIGRRKLLLFGALGFGIVSVAAAFSRTPEMLITTRALLGIAGATLAPSTLSLIFSMFQDPKERAKAIAVWISAFSAGSTIGPILGGVMLEYFWWGSVFLLAVPVMALLLVLGPLVLPEYKDPKEGKIDLISVFLSLTAILSIIFGLKEIAQDGIHIFSLATIILGIVVGYIFVKRQKILKDPMIDISLFAIPSFSASLFVNVMAVFVATGYFLFVAQYLQLVLGLSPLQAGLWSLPSAIGFIVGSNTVPRFAYKFKPAYIIGICIAIAAVGLAILTQVSGTNGLFIVIVASVIISLGLAPVFGLTTELIVGSAPPERAGAASGISETASELGAALGISILGSIGVALYRSEIARSLPAGVPAEAAEIARDTLGGAVSVAGQLPGSVGSTLLTVAQGAFLQGMVVAAIISMVIAVIAAIVSFFLLRNVKGASH